MSRRTALPRIGTRARYPLYWRLGGRGVKEHA
jgi:hypothetical protein